MAKLGTEITHDNGYNRNEDFNKNLVRKLKAKADVIKLGGGKELIERHHKRNKLTARERIEKLIDPGSHFLEIGLFAAYDMYTEYGGAPASGTIFGIGKIHGRDMVIVANDATVKAGAWFPITCKKNLRAQEISIENYNKPVAIKAIYVNKNDGSSWGLKDVFVGSLGSNTISLE